MGKGVSYFEASLCKTVLELITELDCKSAETLLLKNF